MEDELSNEDSKRLVMLVAEVIDSGWQRLKDGSWSRLLKFAKPIPRDLYHHIVLMHYWVSPPTALPVMPGAHKESLSRDRTLLRLHVKPTSPSPRPQQLETLPLTDNLFGRRTIAAA
jgi:hypothetical protein